MRNPFRRAPRPEPREVTALEFYKAVEVPGYLGWHVYVFADPGPAGRVWYVGQSQNIWSRWRDHYYAYRERFLVARKWVIPVRDEAHADITELALIEFYQPECNSMGRKEDLQRKARRLARPHRGELDSGQAAG